MKTAFTLTPSLRRHFAASLLLTVAVAHAQTTPAAPVVPAATVPASIPRRGPPSIPSTPWFGDKTLPTTDELKVLQTARDAAEKDPDVRADTRTYAERFGAADDLVRTLMFNNPAINDPLNKNQLMRYKSSQVLHETTWSIGLDNSPDTLLPDLLFGDWLTIHMSSGRIGPARPQAEALAAAENAALYSPQANARLPAIRASYAVANMHQAALDDKDAKVALQKVRDAFQALDAAVRAAMMKDPAVQLLVEKYPYLLYGRRDLGIGVGASVIMT